MATTTRPSSGWHWREWAAEFAGTALLLFAVVTAKGWIVRVGPPVSEIWIRVALVGAVAGLVVIAVAFSPLGRRSGAHLNPAVTLGLGGPGDGRGGGPSQLPGDTGRRRYRRRRSRPDVGAGRRQPRGAMSRHRPG
jgi:glycerol uptake facilitator-like aquaporin